MEVEVLSADAVAIKPETAVLFERWGGNRPLTGIVRIVKAAAFTKISSLGVEEQRVLVIADITSVPEEWQRLGDGYRVEALSTEEKLQSPKPLTGALRRVKIRGRSVSRKLEAAKVEAGLKPGSKIPKGTRLPVSNNRKKASMSLAKTHYRIGNIRTDFTHKLTTRLCCENQAWGLEDLNVKGMLANHKLALAISDVGFGEIKRQAQYKSVLYGTQIIEADQWFPSSKDVFNMRICKQGYTIIRS